MSSNLTYPFDYLLILDFEATCQRDDRSWPNEIIEFPTVLLNCRTKEVEDEFHHYVQPTLNKTLTDFCIKLTGIQQEWVDQGVPNLGECLTLYQQWMVSRGLIKLEKHPQSGAVTGIKRSKKFAFVTCGSWDLKTCLPKQMDSQNIASTLYKFGIFDDWINIKFSFEQKYKGRKARGMDNMLRELGLTLDGRHHSGIDDCRNITKIVKHMIFEDGARLTSNDRRRKKPQ